MNAENDIDHIEPPDRLAQLRGRIEQIREALLPNGAFEWELAEALDCSRRKIQELKLPFAKVGGTRVYDIAGASKALRRRSSTDGTP